MRRGSRVAVPVGTVFTAADHTRVARCPAGAIQILKRFPCVIVQGGKEFRPVRIDAVGPFEILGIKFGDEGGIGAVEERRVTNIATHFLVPQG